MTTKQDILNYVPFQILQKNLGQIYYMRVDVKPEINVINNTNVFLNVYKATVECNLTEAEMVAKVDELLTSFESFNIDPLTDRTSIAFEDEIAFKIQSKSKRGVGNTKYKNSIYYKGDKLSDSPVIVAECEDRYAVFKHPNFEKYGFVIEKEEPKEEFISNSHGSHATIDDVAAEFKNKG
jgi:hypothetical protein